MAGLLSKERIIAHSEFNRWLVPIAFIAIHLCIGSVYAVGSGSAGVAQTFLVLGLVYFVVMLSGGQG